MADDHGTLLFDNGNSGQETDEPRTVSTKMTQEEESELQTRLLRRGQDDERMGPRSTAASCPAKGRKLRSRAIRV